jgi:hypothetical protein
MSLNFFGIPCKYNSANGVAQLAVLSTKSQIGSPATGRATEVAKAHSVAQINTIRNGQNNAEKAIRMSITPIHGNIVVAKDSEKPNEVIRGIQLDLTPRAKTPCPRNDPNTPNRSIHSTVSTFLTLFFAINLFVFNLYINISKSKLFLNKK